MLNYQRVNHSWICWRPPWLALVTRHSSGGCGDELSRRQPSNLRWDPDQQCPTEPPKLSWWGSPATEKCHSTRFPCHPLPTNNSPPHRHPDLLLGPMGSAQDGENSRPSANAWMAATDPLHPPSGYTKISRFANDVNGQTFRFSLPPIPQRSMLLVRITPCLYNIHKCRSISIRGNFNHHWTNVGKAMRTNPCCDGLSNPFMVKKWGWFTIALPCFTYYQHYSNPFTNQSPPDFHRRGKRLSQRFLGQLAKGLGEVMDCWAGKTVHSLQECCLDSTCPSADPAIVCNCQVRIVFKGFCLDLGDVMICKHHDFFWRGSFHGYVVAKH